MTNTFPWNPETPYRRFIVLSGPRTGSNLLAELLDSHPDVRCFGELFNNEPVIDYRVHGYDGRNASDIALRARDPAALIAQRVFVSVAGAVEAIGFKFHYGHPFFYGGVVEALSADSNLKIVHLRRTNLLRQYVSQVIAEQTGAWMQRHSNPRSSLKRAWHTLRRRNVPQQVEHRELELQPEETERYFWQQILSGTRYTEEVFVRHALIEMTYEDLERDRAAAMRPIWDFLGVPPFGDASSNLVKQNPRPLRQAIANYDELKGHFAESRFASFFTE